MAMACVIPVNSLQKCTAEQKPIRHVLCGPHPKKGNGFLRAQAQSELQERVDTRVGGWVAQGKGQHVGFSDNKCFGFECS